MESIKIYDTKRRAKNLILSIIVGIILFSFFIYREIIFIKVTDKNINLIVNVSTVLIQGVLILFFAFISSRLINKIDKKQPYILLNTIEIIVSGIFKDSIISLDDISAYKEIVIDDIKTIVLKLNPNSEFSSKCSFIKKRGFKCNLSRYGGEIIFEYNFGSEEYYEVLEFMDKKIKNKIQ
ncbi:MAG: hypothetical protein ACRDDL_02845 [Sarcina sp.]